MYTVRLKNGNQHYVKAEGLDSYQGYKFYAWSGTQVVVAVFGIEIVDFVTSEEWIEPKPYQPEALTLTSQTSEKMLKNDVYKLTAKPKIIPWDKVKKTPTKTKTAKKRTTK
jgi:hypothetical protein